MTRSSKDQIIDDSLRLVAIFMKLKDKKARTEILKLAERCAWFDARPDLHDFASPFAVRSKARIEANRAVAASA